MGLSGIDFIAKFVFSALFGWIILLLVSAGFGLTISFGDMPWYGWMFLIILIVIIFKKK